MRKFLTVIFLTFFFLIFTSRPIQAAGEFLTSFSTTYTVDLQGNTTVSQKVTLTNNLSDVYAAEYALEIGSTRIEEVVVFSQDGRNIPVSVTQTNNKTVVVIRFDEVVVGKDQSQVFTIRYKNPDAAQKIGKVLEVSVPRLANESGVDNFDVTLLVPLVFGQPAIVNPTSYSQTVSNQNTVITFSTDEIIHSGITAIFGQEQVFDFNLTYNLENPTVSAGITQVALPPDTAYQRVYYHSIEPEPEAVEVDDDGNWIGTFRLDPKVKLKVVLTGSAILYLEPKVPVKNIVDVAYLLPQKYWEANESGIKELANELKTPRNIYDYLVDNFSYNYDRIERGGGRLGARMALQEPHNAICTEFTDAFVAIARAAGIQARELNGFAYTQNSKLRPLSLVEDVLHAWPEYYDSERQIWVPVDPTWGNTTGGVDYFDHLDFNHLVLAIHGMDPIKPYPAGYYKFAGEESKDVSVDFSTVVPDENIDFDVELDQSGQNWWSKATKLTLLIKNKSNVALYNQVYKINSDNLFIDENDHAIEEGIPPFGVGRIETLGKVIDSNKTTRLIVELPNNETKIFTLEDRYLRGPIYIQKAVGVGLGAIFAFIAYRTGSLLVYRFKQASTLRRQS